MKIETVIKEKYELLTKSEKKIANYVLASKERIVYGTMNDIKKAIKVGDATIVRFCQKLGYSGFSDLKIEVAKESYSQKSSNRTDLSLFFDENENSIIEILHETKSKLDLEQFEKSSKLISEASAIYIFGVGLSGNTAKDLEAMFLRIGVPVKAISDSHFQLQTADLLKKTDLIIGISLSGKTLELFESIKIAKEQKAQIITITSSDYSPLAQLSDINLQTVNEEFLMEAHSLEKSHNYIFVKFWLKITSDFIKIKQFRVEKRLSEQLWIRQLSNFFIIQLLVMFVEPY